VIAALDLTAWVEELNEANTLFDKRFLARIKEQAHHPEVTVAELRKEVIELFRILQDHIKAHAIISKDPRYDALIKEINTLTENYNRTALNRSTGTDNGVSTTDSNPSEEEVN
jgi:hypothetical protein